MPPLANLRSAPTYTLCTFLYPPSCFASSSSSFRALINTIRPRSSGIHSISRRPERASHGRSNIRKSLQTSRRAFTSSPVSRGPPAVLKNVKIPGIKSKSLPAMLKEAQTKSGMPDDIGLFENTLIMPTGDSKPSIFKQPKLRAQLEWFRLYTRVNDFVRVLIYKFSFGKPRPQLSFRKTASIARGLHEQMYHAFAGGNTAKLRTLCTEGLQEQFQRRLGGRQANATYKWQAHRYIGRPRVVSHKASILPVAAQSIGQRQAVVRIESEQSLAKIDAKTGRVLNVVSADGEVPRERKVEYLVVQQRFSEETGAEPWRVWGTVSEKGWRNILSQAGYFVE